VSPPDDRVAVPTNGHRKAMPENEQTTPVGTERGSGTPTAVTSDRGPRANVPAVSPGQLAAGFGIIAALILLFIGRRRGRRD
jgi:hypothetical protein